MQFSPSGLQLRRAGAAWQSSDSKAGLEAPANPDLVRKLLDALRSVQSNAPVNRPEGRAECGGFCWKKATTSIWRPAKTRRAFGMSPSICWVFSAGCALKNSSIPQNESAATLENRFGLNKPILKLHFIRENDDTAASVRFGLTGGRLFAQTLNGSPNMDDAGSVFGVSSEGLTSIQGTLDKILPPLRSAPSP